MAEYCSLVREPQKPNDSGSKMHKILCLYCGKKAITDFMNTEKLNNKRMIAITGPLNSDNIACDGCEKAMRVDDKAIYVAPYSDSEKDSHQELLYFDDTTVEIRILP
jgi:hypothetical protein